MQKSTTDKINSFAKSWLTAMFWKWLWRFGFMALGGVLGLAHVPHAWLFMVFIALPAMAWLVLTIKTPARALGFGWWVSLGYFLVCLQWLLEPFQVEAESFGWLAPFGLFGLAGLCAFVWMWAFWLTRLVANRASLGVYSTLIVWIILLAFADYGRSYFLTGLSWATLSYVWVNTPMAQLAAYIGPHGLSLLTLALVCLPVAAVAHGHKWWRVPVGAGVIFAVLWLVASARPPDIAPPHLQGLVVRLIQPNAPQHLKWREDMIKVFFDRGLEFTAADSEILRVDKATGQVTTRPDIVIWPEASLPFPWDGDSWDHGMPMLQTALAGANFIGGIRREDRVGLYNSLLAYAPSSAQVDLYDKHHLVPWGEFLPYESALRWLGLTLLTDNISSLAVGSGPRIINLEGMPPFLPLICYEAVFPYNARVAGGRPDWLVHITNDAWFGVHTGPFQHFAQAQMRAIEQGLPVARSANTGVSGMIDPYGRVVDDISLGVAGFVDAALPAALPATVYARTGEWLWLAVGMFGLVGVGFRRMMNGEL